MLVVSSSKKSNGRDYQKEWQNHNNTGLDNKNIASTVKDTTVITDIRSMQTVKNLIESVTDFGNSKNFDGLLKTGRCKVI